MQWAARSWGSMLTKLFEKRDFCIEENKEKAKAKPLQGCHVQDTMKDDEAILVLRRKPRLRGAEIGPLSGQRGLGGKG